MFWCQVLVLMILLLKPDYNSFKYMWFSGLCMLEFSSISGCGCFVLVQHSSAGTLFLLSHSRSPPSSPLPLLEAGFSS